MSVPEVLVVDDDVEIRDALTAGLTQLNLRVRTASDGLEAMTAFALRRPDVVLLDIGMPGLSGLEVIRRLRADGHLTPICVLSGRDEVDDRVAGLAAGADDYVVKPFSVIELAARLKALVRLERVRNGAPMGFADIVVDPGRHMATRGGRDLGLTAREFDLLVTLVQHPGQVLSRSQLLDAVWGYSWDVDSNVVDVFVGYLRRKLEADGAARVLHTVRGVGFALRQ